MSKKTIAVLFVVSFLVRLFFNIFVIGLSSDPWEARFEAPDSVKYHTLAMSVTEGKGLQGSAHAAPGYPVFLAILYACGGVNFALVRVAQCVLGSVMVVFVALLAGLIFHRPLHAVAAGVIAAFYPFFIFWTAMFLTETLFIVLSVSSVYYIMKYLEAGGRGYCVLGAILLGLAALTRPIVLTMPFFIGIVIYAYRRSLVKTLIELFVFCCIVAAVLAPWTMRNYRVFHAFIPVASQSGINLLAGMNSRVLEDVTAMGRYTYHELDEFKEQLQGMDEAERDKAATAIVVNYYKQVLHERPLFLVRLLWEKFIQFWDVVPDRALKYKILSVCSYGMLLPFFLIGLLRSGKHFPVVLLVLFSILNPLLIGMIYFTNIRYRFPIEPFYVVIATGGIFEAITYCKKAFTPKVL